MAHNNLPTVCIVGRPNVGKSTLFNRIIGKRKAVEHDTCGTTRDSVEALYEREEKRFRLVDTGGFLKTSTDKMSDLVKTQITNAIKEADLLVCVCDVRTGITQQDEEAVTILRQSNKKTILIVNKVDNSKFADDIFDFYRLGLGEPHPVSALHNAGCVKIVDRIMDMLNLTESDALTQATYKIAITGRPNVGKSYFLNTILEKERVIVSDIPGTTRDSIDTHFEKDGNTYLLIDTAGIRHKRKVKEAIDVYSMARSQEAIGRSDLSFLLIDGYEGLKNDDVRVLNHILDAGKCCIVVVNKWDLVKGTEMSLYKKAIIRKTHTMTHYPIVFASAKTGRNVLSSIDLVKETVDTASSWLDTQELNQFLSDIKRFSGRITKRAPKMDYMVQTGVKPPEFLIFVDHTKLVTDDFTNFLESGMRRKFGFHGTPLKFDFRRKKR